MQNLNLTIENLGPIKKAEINISPLTIICGSNNSGKTYISYAIYGLLKSWYPNLNLGDFSKYAAELIETGTTKIPTEPTQAKQEGLMQALFENYAASLDTLFSAPENTFKDAKISTKTKFKSPPPEDSTGSFSIGEMRTIVSENQIEIQLLNKSKSITQQKLGYFLNIYCGLIMFGEHFPSPFLATAERLGISLFYKELDTHRNVLVDTLIQMKDSQNKFDPHEMLEKVVSRYSAPVKDHIQFTRDLETIKKGKSFLQTEVEKIYTDIEKMLGGEYKLTGQEMVFKSKSKSTPYIIPSYLGSSAVRSLSDIYFYLKHKARRDDLLLIDEPESHLTPANQIQIARIIARLVNAGINVFITTHSDYIIKELNNLICLNSEFSNRDSILKKYSYRQTDKLDPNKISAYIAKNGKLEQCLINNKGIEVKNLDEAIEQINATADDLMYYMDI